MLNFLRRLFGNGEKIAIGNKICIGIFILICIVSITTLWESRKYAEIESVKVREYNKLRKYHAFLVEQNMNDPEITALKVEVEGLKAKLAAEVSKRTAKAKLDEDFKLQFSFWNGSHRNTVEYVKERMHNPKSFEHVETRYTDYAEKGFRHIQMKYRGTNLFNAVVTNSIWVKVDLNGNVIEVLKTE